MTFVNSFILYCFYLLFLLFYQNFHNWEIFENVSRKKFRRTYFRENYFRQCIIAYVFFLSL